MMFVLFYTLEHKTNDQGIRFTTGDQFLSQIFMSFRLFCGIAIYRYNRTIARCQC